MKIHHGETLTLTAAAVDDGGEEVTIGAGWQAACAIKSAYAGTPVLTAAMPIASGVASLSIDTGDPEWAPGAYRYDIRLTDPAGNDYWIDTQELGLLARITGAS